MGKWRARRERGGGSYFTAPFKESYGMPGWGLYVLQYNRMGGRTVAEAAAAGAQFAGKSGKI